MVVPSTKNSNSLNNVNSEMLDHAKKEIVMDEAFVKSIMETEGYQPLGKSHYSIGDISDDDFFRN